MNNNITSEGRKITRPLDIITLRNVSEKSNCCCTLMARVPDNGNGNKSRGYCDML